MKHWLCMFALTSGCGDDGTCVPDPLLPSDASMLPEPLTPACTGTACGGDLAGTWETTDSCVRGEGQFLADCSESSIRIDGATTRWRMTLAGDGAFTVTVLDESVQGRVFAPLSCVPFQDCEGVEAGLALQGITGSCRDVRDGCAAAEAPPGACDCDITVTAQDQPIAASITSTGPTTFDLTAGGEVIPVEYCVQTDEMWWHGKRFGGVDYYYRFRRVP